MKLLFEIHRLVSLLVLLGFTSLFAQNKTAIPRQPNAEITAKVIDETGNPLGGAKVVINFLVGQQGSWGTRDLSHEGESGSDGIFAASDQCGGAATLAVAKDGYYTTVSGYYLFKKRNAGKWEPWNPTIEMMLKPVLNPIPMYAKKMGLTKPFAIPVVGQPVGFDMIAGDWVAPHGKGSVSDMLFTLTEKVPYVSAEQPFDVTLTVAFSNKGDGIQSVLVPLNRGSEFRLPRYAPEDGYEPQLVKEIAHATGEPIASGTREDQNYFVRVRTVLDEKGKVQSALYAKIDGDIQFWGNRKTRFTYYLNPNPNDRNMEFDLKQNLAGDLPFNERVTKP